MDDHSRIKKEKGFHRFLDLIPNEKRQQPRKIKEEASSSHELDKSLELRLGPPASEVSTTTPAGGANKNQDHQSQPFCNNLRLPSEKHGKERTAPSHNTVVGWPPIRTSRKNLITSGGGSSYNRPESRIVGPVEERKKLLEEPAKNTLVKIYMDGIPIGRKVDLKACGSYEELSHAVHKLFGWLLEAQNGNACDANMAFRGLLDGSGEYVLVYDDNEGDKMVVGDVPWNMFVPTVKRLRVMKRSEISTLIRREKRKAFS